MRSNQVVSVEDGKIEKITCDNHADGVQTDVVGTGAAVTVAIKAGHGIAAATLQLRAENVGKHWLNYHGRVRCAASIRACDPRVKCEMPYALSGIWFTSPQGSTQ